MGVEEGKKETRIKTLAWLRIHVVSVKTDLNKPFGKEHMLNRLFEELK